MKKTTLPLIILVALLNLTSQAQVAQELVGKYPAYILFRVYQVTSKTNLVVQKQLQLAEYYKSQDDINNKDLSDGKQLSDVMEAYSKQQLFLKKFLSPLEYNDYKFINNQATSQLAKALKFRDVINLKTPQTDQLLKNLAILETKKTNYKPLNSEDNFNSRQFEGDVLSRTLTNDQYSALLKIINKPKALAENSESWTLLKSKGYLKDQDTAKVFTENLNFYVNRSAAEAMVLNSRTPEKMDSVKHFYENHKPEILSKLTFMSSKLPNSQFATTINYKAELQLKPGQIDSLLKKAAELERLRANYAQHNVGRYNGHLFEMNNLRVILTPQQFNDFLRLKNKDQANQVSKSDWVQIKALGISAGLDSTQVITSSYSYHLEYLVANEYFNIEKSQKNAFAKKDVENDKPAILQRMDAMLKERSNNKSAKKTFQW